MHLGGDFGQRQVDLKGAADFDFREFADRVTELEKTDNLCERFSQLEHQLAARQKALLSQDELLAKMEGLQRQIDDLKRVADLDVRFHEFVERITELEKTNSLEARFTKLANEAKGGSEVQRSDLLARIDRLQRQIDELKRVAGEPGPQGPPGPPGKLPLVKEYAAGRVHYQADVVGHVGALWQARSDTVHAPPHSDWLCVAKAGRDGLTPTICGTYDAYGKYKKLDVVACDGASFIAKRDNPGICPGDGWQLLSRQGKSGRRGESGDRGPRGEKGEKGEPGATIRSWELDRERYAISPLMSDGTVGPLMELRPMFEYFMHETGGGYNEAGK